MKAALILVLFSSCAAGWNAVAYEPRALVGADPRAQIEEIIKSKPGCIAHVEWLSATLRVEAVCDRAEALQYVAHFDRVATVELKQHNKVSEWYLVTVTHQNDASPPFYWQPRNLAEAQRLVDALDALRAPGPSAKPAGTDI